MAARTPVRFMTWNLRFDSMPDNITVPQTISSLPNPITEPAVFLNLTGEQPWSTRRIKVYERIIGEGIQILGCQEALVRQVDDLQELLGDGWDHVGVGRDDGVDAGEFSPIYWNKSLFTLINNDTFWLSQTPFVAGSKFPGAGSVRIATATHFKLNKSGKRFTYINTHLDDQSDAQRQLGASLILWRAHSEASNGSTVILTGDFNSQAAGDGSGAYQIITGQLAPIAINQTFKEAFPIAKRSLPNFEMLDLRTQLPRISVAGNWATFTGFVDPADSSQYIHIDFIFGGNNGGWGTTFHKVENQLTDDGVLASDHRPVIADLLL
ncbi:mannose-6-phosphatase [Vararia minispora EC-137]|uniref:Mannose-6-phosphatase n=1 Tax=Vararia minispora EC-137 TaxID=1314806 RepID=A0ACB8QK83_9AGAM|nr:mannose-6-phosphatase [Vararia minispora EC-137]